MFSFWNLYQILNILKNKMIVRATLLRNLWVVKDLVTLLSKKHSFTTLFDSQHVKGSQILVKFASEHFHHIFHHSVEFDLKNISLKDMLNLRCLL